MLADLGELRRRSAGHVHPASLPLIVLGVLALAGAAADWLARTSLFAVAWMYWVIAGSADLLLTAWWYRRLRLRDGAGRGEGDIVTIALLVGCGAIVGAFFPLGGPITAIGFYVVTRTRHSRALAWAAAGFGVMAGLEQPFHALSNGLTRIFPSLAQSRLITEHGTTAILAALGLVLLAIGGTALRRERI